ncbi:MAG: hypothetical protein JOZ99_11705 [Actinobacteria bacterium]|nr:hypothetical protein [Actinomycetota bacterium]
MSDMVACGGGDEGRPFVAGTLRGYRTWHPLTRWSKVPDGSLPLAAVAQRDVVWPPTLTARCIPPRFAGDVGMVQTKHDAPRSGCTCGIYAWYDPVDAGIFNARVFGAVQASGLILMGDRGFRAERARITAIVTRNRRIAAACSDAGIAVYRHRRDLIREHPPEDLTSLLGHPPVTTEERELGRARQRRANRTLVFALCGRTAVIVAAALALPWPAAVLAAVIAEVVLIMLIMTLAP